MPTTIATGTPYFLRTGIAGRGVRTILNLLRAFQTVKRLEDFSLWTIVEIVDRIIGKGSDPIISAAVDPIVERNVGSDMSILDALDILNGSIRLSVRK